MIAWTPVHQKVQLCRSRGRPGWVMLSQHVLKAQTHQPLTPHCPAHTQAKSLTHRPSAGFHLQTSLKRKRKKNHGGHWLDIRGLVYNANKHYVSGSRVGMIQHGRTKSSCCKGHLESHITHTSEEQTARTEGGSFTKKKNVLDCPLVVSPLSSVLKQYVRKHVSIKFVWRFSQQELKIKTKFHKQTASKTRNQAFKLMRK